MIGKTTHGADFGGLLKYLLNPDKKPEIICPYLLGDNYTDLAGEFQAVADLRPTTELPVRHISLSFAPGDKVDDLQKALIVDQVMEAMGYRDCQYIAIAHHRDDPGHDLIHNHDHVHIVANAVDVYGERVSDSFERYRIQPILRAVEQEWGLQPVQNSWDIKRAKAHAQYPVTDLSVAVAGSLENCHDLKSWLDCLAQNDIDVRFALRKDGKVTGISYLKDGEIHKGSEIGASWAVVDRRLSTTLANYPLITAANAKSQAHQVNLSSVDRQQLDHAVEMAVTALKDKPRLKTGRIDIKMENQTLSVYRMRPHKQMFKMSKTAQGWEPVGFPNLDAKDLELLSKISGMPKTPQLETARARAVIAQSEREQQLAQAAAEQEQQQQAVCQSSPQQRKGRGR